MDQRARDALAILAHFYLTFGRAAEAASLLAALARLDGDPAWALRTRCLALLQAGEHEAAAAEAERLLAGTIDDAARSNLLRVLAKANWRLGRDQEARTHQLAAQEVALVEVLSGPARRPRG
jgi:predicted Zn-dependent protease